MHNNNVTILTKWLYNGVPLYQNNMTKWDKHRIKNNLSYMPDLQTGASYMYMWSQYKK